MAPAKINLGLHVLRKRLDGYHDIETVFIQTGWADRIKMQAADTFSFTCSDPTLPINEDNLCVRAIHRLEEACNIRANVALHLDKVLPYGAGLGGGSSDAAAVLQLLVNLYDLKISQEHLEEVAASLGSDISFFLGAPAAVGTGRGEILVPLKKEGKVYTLPYTLLLVVPPVHVSTAEAYQFVRPDDRRRPDLTELILSDDLARWKAELVNDFEHSVFRSYPIISEVKQMLYAAGAGYAAMSGSGSSVFGVFEDKLRALEAGEHCKEKGMKVWVE